MGSNRKTNKNGPTEDSCCAPPGQAPGHYEADPESDQRLAVLAKALGHPARVAIVRLLLSRKACMCGEIVEELPLAQSTVSQHLSKLKQAGILRGEIDGPRVCYCVEPGVLEALRDLLQALEV